MKFKTLSAIIALSAAAPVAAQELSDTGDFLDGVAAIVNEGVVLKSQVQERIIAIVTQAQAAEQPIPLPPADVLQEQVLERLIIEEIQLQRADRIGLQVPDGMVNETIDEIARSNGHTLDQMPEILAAQGLTYSTWREALREELTLEQLRRIDVGQRINVSPRELQQCLIDLETNVVANSAYNLSHILVSLPEGASAELVEETQAKIDDVYQQIMDGADFREMAIRYSEGQTALEGGALGWIEGPQVPTLFTEVLTTMSDGDVSEPFRWTNSFHIVKVNELRSAMKRSEINQIKARHILVTPNEIIDDDTARQRLEDALERIAEGEDFGEIAKLLSDDAGTKNDGGDLGWTGPGTFVPEFEQALGALEVGEISEPFRSPFGWHVAEVLERRVYDNTEELKERNCDLRIRNSKMEDETQQWIRRLRDEAYVDKRI